MTLTRGSSLRRPAFICANGGLQRFDLAVANPMWNQHVSHAVHRDDRFGRFNHGWPSRDGDWVWMQHLLAHLADGGRMVVMLDRDATSRSNDLAEVDVRKSFVESDLIEAVVLCPWEISRPRWLVRSGVIETPQAVLFVVNKAKKRPGAILFMDTRPLVVDYLAGGLTPDAVHNKVMNALNNWTMVPRVAKIVSNTDVAKSDFILAPEFHCADACSYSARLGQRLGQEHPAVGPRHAAAPAGGNGHVLGAAARGTGLRSGATHRRLRPASSGPLSPGDQG